jgi:alpha-D-xyloside xylohydrolase
MRIPSLAFILSLFAGSLAFAAAAPERLPDGLVVPVGDTWHKIEVRADDIIRVCAAKDRAFFDHASIVIDDGSRGRPPHPQWTLDSDAQAATLRTAKLQVRVVLATGAVSFLDSSGQPILAEEAGGRTLESAEVLGEKTYHVRQIWTPNNDEALYGLGQNQLGLLNIEGRDLDLWQRNTIVAVPFFVSSRGYGVLWDNTSFTRFGDLRAATPPPAARLYGTDGQAGGLTGTYFAGAGFDKPVAATHTDAKIDIELAEADWQNNALIHAGLPAGDLSVRWEGDIEPETSGEYQFRTFANGDVKLWVDGRLVINHWRQDWLPSDEVAYVPLEAGHRHHLRLEWIKDFKSNVIRFTWKTPAPSRATSLWSEVGDGTDYYFVYGPSLDRVIAGYRELTGRAALMPRWSFGLWQSRQRYRTSQESLDVVDGFRRRGIPFDVIVQDWFYWRAGQWGSHEFDPARFPDPAGWVRGIHERHAKLMISVWGKFYPGNANFDALHARGFLYEPNLTDQRKDWLGYPFTYYDAFNPAARDLFWSQIDRNLFRLGIDAWWMDATEPDFGGVFNLDRQRTHMNPTALGSGARVLNGYALENARGIYEHQRQAAPDQRVFNLTRSGFAGQQRYAAATWSGDISSTWTAMAKQIQAGLGFSISGIPYWTQDSGGFSVPRRFVPHQTPAGMDIPPGPATPADIEEWRELNTRWFEFSTFTPILRAHGEFPYREMWEFGGDQSPAYAAMLKFDRLRYRLQPWLYSLAGAVTHDNASFMRPLVMDFPADATARNVNDAYLFGREFLVAPVTAYQARSRSVYLPDATGGWFDFWSGKIEAGGRTIDAPAPFDAMPLFVRAGSIVPMGPALQYTGEKSADPVTVWVYAGANGEFTLYEDDGLTYGYERGEFTRIPLKWNDATRTLTIGARSGSFPGMLRERTFQIVFVGKDQPVGFSFEPQPSRTVRYTGESVEIFLK